MRVFFFDDALGDVYELEASGPEPSGPTILKKGQDLIITIPDSMGKDEAADFIALTVSKARGDEEVAEVIKEKANLALSGKKRKMASPFQTLRDKMSPERVAANTADASLCLMADRLATKETTSRGDQGDLLHEMGYDAALGRDEESVQTHTDLEPDDLEDVDTRPKQGSSLEDVARRVAAIPADIVKIRVTEDPNRVEVEYLGKTHSADWEDEGVLENVDGDEDLLRAAMAAWDGSDEMDMNPEELEQRGDGWWSSQPDGVADDKEMWDAIFVSISWDPALRGLKDSGPGGPPALDTVYGLILQAGYQPNGFELDQEVGPGNVVGNLGVSKGLYESVEDGDGFWESSQGDVKVEFEIP